MNKARHSGESRNPVTDNLDLWTSALLTRSSAGRGSNGKQEAYGIKRLRELILELAVSGRLLENDTSKWTDAFLGEIGEWGSGGTPLKAHSEYYGGDIPWLVIGDLNDGLVTDAETHITKFGLDNSSARMVPVGTLLIAMYGSIGKLGITGISCATNQAIAYCIPDKERVNTKYLFLYLRAIRDQLLSRGQGLAQQNISQKILKATAIKLPPLAEQHSIVAKVDELMALCDQLEQQQTHSLEAHQTLVETLLGTLTGAASHQELTEAWIRIADHFDTLFTTEHSIDQLKQAILQVAVMGKLVPQDSRDEPAGQLLKKIVQQKQVLREAKQFRQGKVSRPQTAFDAPMELPSGWKWVNVDSLCFKVTDGTHFTPQYVESGVRFVSAKDIVGGVLSFDQCKFISQEEHERLYRRCNPEYHDIVISKSGSIGTVALVEDRRQFSLFESLALLKFDQKSLLPQYLVYALTHACASLTAGHIRGVGVKHLHLDILRGLELALPPHAEQHRIVAKVDELMALCGALKECIKDAKTTQIHLADAIVEQAVNDDLQNGGGTSRDAVEPKKRRGLVAGAV